MTGAVDDERLAVLESRLAAVDWSTVGAALDTHGFALVEQRPARHAGRQLSRRDVSGTVPFAPESAASG